MAARAAAADATVIEYHCTPTGLGYMAGIALGTGSHMPRGFTGGGGTVVATRAVAANTTVIEYHCIPAGL